MTKIECFPGVIQLLLKKKYSTNDVNFPTTDYSVMWYKPIDVVLYLLILVELEIVEERYTEYER